MLPVARYLIIVPIFLLAQLSRAQAPVIEPPKFSFPNYTNSTSLQQLKTATITSNWAFSQIYKDIQSRNQAIVHQDLKEYQQRTTPTKADEIIADAVSSFRSGSSIAYELPRRSPEERQSFEQAFSELSNMLSGKHPMDLKRAVFLSEHAFDPSITWDEFNAVISDMVTHLGYKMQNESIDPNDHLSKNLSLFQFFTDTLRVKHPGLEQPVVSYPMLYDFDDFWGHQDYRNTFVSKLMKTGSGQCHSLPLLYLILAEQTNTPAHLAFSPSHSYIKIQDNKGQWHNLELTNGMFTTDQYLMYSGFIKAEALANQLYLQPLTKKQVIAQVLNDLAISYTQKFGYDDFVPKCTFLANYHGLKSMTIHKLNHNYFNTRLQYIIQQYEQAGLTPEDFKKDPEAMAVYNSFIGAQKHIRTLGYAEMPPEQYQQWLESVQQESRKQEHRNTMRSLMGTVGNN